MNDSLDAENDEARAVLSALPAPPLDPALSRRVLRAARGELLASRWDRAGRFIAHIAVPAALIACAAGYAYHYVQVAERVYSSHGGAGL